MEFTVASVYPLNIETDWTRALLHKTCAFPPVSDVNTEAVFVSVACFMRYQLAFTNHGQIEFIICE